MAPTWFALIGKECHEQKWKLASLAAIVLAVQVSLTQTDGKFDPFAMYLTQALCAPPIALFIAMGVAAGESAAGTLEFMRALPIPRRQFATVRLMVGAATCLAAIGLPTQLVMWWATATGAFDWTAWTTTSGESNFGLGQHPDVVLYGLPACFALCLYVWAVAAAIGQPTELRAGLWALAVWIVWLIAAPASDLWLPGWSVRLHSLGPLYWMGSAPQEIALVAWPQIFIAAALAASSIARYGRLARADNRSPAEITGPEGSAGFAIGRACGSRLSAMLWMQLRQATPLTMIGPGALALILLMITCSPAYGPHVGVLELLAMGVYISAVPIGLLTALIVAVGSFVPDLQRGLLEFWRSRPITPTRWFWTKYLVGAAALAVFLASPMLAGAWLAGDVEAQFVPLLITVPWMLLPAYSIAVCCACLVRQAVYAGILALATSVGLMLLVFRLAARFTDLIPLSPLHVIDRLSYHARLAIVAADRLRYDDTLLYTGFVIEMVTVAAVAALLAWRSIARPARFAS